MLEAARVQKKYITLKVKPLNVRAPPRWKQLQLSCSPHHVLQRVCVSTRLLAGGVTVYEGFMSATRVHVLICVH